MRVDLRELLQHHEIVHPTRMTSISAADGVLRISVEGYPWWRAKDGHEGDKAIVFIFEGVTGSLLCLDDMFSKESYWADEVLEDFSVFSVSRPSWAGPHDYSVYASGPLPEPGALFTLLEDYLWAAEATKSARDVLNMPGGLFSSFKEICTSRSYLVARGPLAIREIICDELKRQSVPHNVVHTPLKENARLIVRLGGSTLFCDAAFAEFD